MYACYGIGGPYEPYADRRGQQWNSLLRAVSRSFRMPPLLRGRRSAAAGASNASAGVLLLKIAPARRCLHLFPRQVLARLVRVVGKKEWASDPRFVNRKARISYEELSSALKKSSGKGPRWLDSPIARADVPAPRSTL
jgi:crotonobetainyl-CoA:carnitine CoA-transferase CaiB-like acyl-CoA transferase